MRKHTRLFITSLVMLSVLTAMPLSAAAAQPNADKPSAWAEAQVNAAVTEGLVPAALQSDYAQAATRAEFCALVAALYENVKGGITGRAAFNDTNDVNVEKAAAIGVVSGTDTANGLFSPDAPLTREQAASMLARLADAVGSPLTGHGQGADFSDKSSISDWAVGAVNQVSAAGVMGSTGTAENVFSPKDAYTREQSIVTVFRLYETVNSSQSVNYEIGQVSVLSNSTVYDPYIHFLYSAKIIDNERLSVDGLHISLEDISSALPQIPYSDGFQVTVDGKDAVASAYSLYNDKFESVYSGQEDFSFPNEAGAYLLCVDVTWGNGERGTQYSEYTGNRYIFKVGI